MSCVKCESKFVVHRFFTMKELAKGSPTRGRNVKWIDVKVHEIKCPECQTTQHIYG